MEKLRWREAKICFGNSWQDQLWNRQQRYGGLVEKQQTQSWRNFQYKFGMYLLGANQGFMYIYMNRYTRGGRREASASNSLDSSTNDCNLIAYMTTMVVQSWTNGRATPFPYHSYHTWHTRYRVFFFGTHVHFP